MKEKFLFIMLVLLFSLSALAAAQANIEMDYDVGSDEDETDLPPQPGEPGINDTDEDRESDGRTAVGFERYWEMEETTPISDSDRQAIERRAEAMLADNFSRDNFIMPPEDFNRAREERNSELYVIELTDEIVEWEEEQTTVAGANVFAVDDLIDNVDRIPEDRTVVVAAEDDFSGAMSVAILRMIGYNAWYAEGVQAGAGDDRNENATARTNVRDTDTTQDTGNENGGILGTGIGESLFGNS